MRVYWKSEDRSWCGSDQLIKALGVSSRVPEWVLHWCPPLYWPASSGHTQPGLSHGDQDSRHSTRGTRVSSFGGITPPPLGLLPMLYHTGSILMFLSRTIRSRCFYLTRSSSDVSISHDPVQTFYYTWSGPDFFLSHMIRFRCSYLIWSGSDISITHDPVQMFLSHRIRFRCSYLTGTGSEIIQIIISELSSPQIHSTPLNAVSKFCWWNANENQPLNTPVFSSQDVSSPGRVLILVYALGQVWSSNQ